MIKSKRWAPVVVKGTLAMVMSIAIGGSALAYSYQTEPLLESINKPASSFEKHKFVEESKKQAKLDWNELQAKLVEEQIQAEKDAEAELQRQIDAAYNRKVRLKKEALRQVEEHMETAEKDAIQLTKEAEEYAKEMKRKAAALARKRQREKEQAARMSGMGLSTDLGDYVSYTTVAGGDSSVKSYMGYKAITDVSSDQWKLQHSGKVYTGNYGIRMVDGRYCAALGSHYATKIGTKFDVIMKSGKVIRCILAEQKSDDDTDSTHSYHLSDGSYLEFVIDTDQKDSRVDGSYNAIPDFEGRIAEFRVYK